METIEKVFYAISKNLDRFVALIVLPAIFLVVITDVFLRYVFNAPLIWGLEFNEWMLLMIFALAIPECTRQNGHIRMELVVANMPPRVQAAFDAVYSACAIWLFYLLGRHAWEEFLFDLELGRITEYVQLPIWLQQFAVFAMCVILIFYFVMRFIATLLNAKEFSRTDSTGLGD
ncbi:MAG: TRAP-type C4-dicarboxylate transport system permease small subunit [Alphaproteobacteria bacterium]|jgi:TRAP-type C4-dicarboxylate transport system permease small subunit